MKTFNIQRFAEETTTVPTGYTSAADLEPGISIDLATRMTSNLDTLRKIISTNELVPMASGTTIKMYTTKVKTSLAAQPVEGNDIAVTETQRSLKTTAELVLKKYRKVTTAEAIQKIGTQKAINDTDRAVLSAVQKSIKDDFFTLLTTGTGTATAKAHGLQAALAAAWGQVAAKFEDVDATPVFFVSTSDVADYLATAQVSLQTAFGLTYIENFLGLGTAFVSPSITSGKVYATAKENLFCAYIPANTGDLAKAFGLTSDETGLVGLTHSIDTHGANIDTLIMSGVKFYPEDLSAIVKVTITAATGS